MLIPNAPAVGEMSEGLGTIPEATYHLRVHKAEYVPVPKSSTAKGPYIKATHVVASSMNVPEAEQYVGRFIFQNYSLTGDGSFRLRELLKVAGKPDDYRLTDDQELVGIEFLGAVVIQTGTGGYSDKNEVKRHMPLV